LTTPCASDTSSAVFCGRP